MFRKFVVIMMTAAACFLSVGCYSIKMAAPSDADVKLIPPAKSAAFKTEIKSWYLLWGLVPLSNADDGVSNAVKANNLTEVRLETKQTFVDWLISTVLICGLVGTYTTAIEGNAGGDSSGSGFAPPSYDSGSGAASASASEDSGSGESSDE